MMRGGRRRSRGPRVRINSFKKVLNITNGSVSAGNNTITMALGVDGAAATQANATDGNVPTGSSIKGFLMQFSATNNVAAGVCYVNWVFYFLRAGQSADLDPVAIGGSSNRNQVMKQGLFSIGEAQNSNHQWFLKIPPRFQRLQEGTSWRFSFRNTATINRQAQVIYKFQH